MNKNTADNAFTCYVLGAIILSIVVWYKTDVGFGWMSLGLFALGAIPVIVFLSWLCAEPTEKVIPKEPADEVD